jgi:hypothetical protein
VRIRNPRNGLFADAERQAVFEAIDRPEGAARALRADGAA